MGQMGLRIVYMGVIHKGVHRESWNSFLERTKK